MSEPTSTKPYLLRAIYEWCVDNGYTPHVCVKVDSQTRVPMEHVRNGEIVLNIGPLAAGRLQIGNELIECTARFSGAAKELVFPVSAVTAIYARENGQGMSFQPDEKGPATESDNEAPGAPSDSPDAPKRGGKPSLRRVK
jgi:stringent starvation protein B